LSFERRRILLSLGCHYYPFLGHQTSLASGPVFGVHYDQAI
jgi:hypothetical protein